MNSPMDPLLPQSVEMLELFGFEFHLDYDGELSITRDDAMTMERIQYWLEEHFKAALSRRLEVRRSHQLMVCVGGPFNGERHGWSDLYGRCLYGRRIKRACWAVYKLGDDGRAFFQGYAKSEAKARGGVLYEFKAKT